MKSRGIAETARWITLFNHKGGVGKTTFAIHLAAVLSARGVKTLLVDADPQCNLSAYLIESSVLDKILDSSDSPRGKTIWTSLLPLVDGSGDVRAVRPQETSLTNVDLIVGDIRLSEFEQALGGFWQDAAALRSRGFRGISGIAQVVRQAEQSKEYDVIICDTGPSISDLNRSILMSSDDFVVPTFPDVFSIRALKTLGVAIHRWCVEWQRLADMAPMAFDLLMPGNPKFLGYVLQKATGSGMDDRTQAGLAVQIEKAAYSDVAEVLGLKPRKSFSIGVVPDLGMAAVKAQLRGVPVWGLSESDCPEDIAIQSKAAFEKIANQIIKSL